MDYEKKYNEALKWMRELYPGLHGATKEDAEHFFPELRESEDERIRRTLVEYFGPQAQLDFVRGIPIQKIRDWLEKQKEQKPLETPSPSVIYTEQGEVLAEQKPAEWSDEDEKKRQRIIKVIEAADSDWVLQKAYGPYGDLINWLKSLRPDTFQNGNSRPKTSDNWKPSEEQMKALQHAIDACESEWAYQDDELRSLLNDLKKL